MDFIGGKRMKNIIYSILINENAGLPAFFDLRERESFVQLTNPDPSTIKTLHLQLFDD